MTIRRTGIAVVRIQPLHRGHTNHIQRMIETYETVIICIGSADKSRTSTNPFTVEERITMLDNVFGNRIRIVPVRDLGATSSNNDWCDYVIDKIVKLGLPEPTDYHTGSRQDSLWYRGRFFNGDDNPTPEQFTKAGQLRKLHVLDRRNLPFSATEVRGFLEMGDDGWKDFVPKVNWEFIEKSFPTELLMIKP